MTRVNSLAELNLSPEFLAAHPEIAAELKKEKMGTPSKYGNARTAAKGMVFQSGREASGVAELILLEEQHKIFGLRLQVRFPLPGHNAYIADAVYSELRDGKLTFVVKDFKGMKTKEYVIKSRLFKEAYGQAIEEE